MPISRTPSLMLLTGLCAGVLGVGDAEANRLLDVYQVARQQDPVLRAAAADRGVAAQNPALARAALLPSLAAVATHDRERYDLDGGRRAVEDPADPQPTDTARFSATRTTYGLDLRQPLFDLQAFQRLREAKLLDAQGEAEYRAAEQDLVLRVAESYFAVLAAADTLSANRAERDAYAALVSQAQKRLQTGLGARIGVEEAQAFYSFTEQAVIDAELTLLDAQRALMQLTAQSLPVAPLRDDIPLEAPVPARVEDWLAASRSDNPRVQAAQLRVRAAVRSADAVGAQHVPTLALRGSMGRTDAPEVLGGDQRIDSIGVVAQWPILEGGRVRAEQRVARERQRAAEAEQEARLRQTERETLAAFRGVMASVRTIRAGQRAVDANRIALEASRNGVEAGTRTEFDLLNAQNNYYAALRAYYLSRYDYLRNGLRLKAQAGRLGEDDLAVIDALLTADSIAIPTVLDGEFSPELQP